MNKNQNLLNTVGVSQKINSNRAKRKGSNQTFCLFFQCSGNNNCLSSRLPH